MDPQHRGVKCRINSGSVNMEKLYKWRIQRWEDWWNKVGKTSQEAFNRTGRVGSNWADLQTFSHHQETQTSFSFGCH